MRIEFTSQQKQRREVFRAFADEHITPFADLFDQKEATPPELIKAFAKAGLLGLVLPREYGGEDVDQISFGLLCEAVARSSASVLGLLTVHNMASQSILRWGTERQKQRWLPAMAKGEVVGGLALTEPEAGSDGAGITMLAERDGDGYVLNGEKSWITYGLSANLFVVFARLDDKPTAFLLEDHNPGLIRNPIKGMLGFRAANLANLVLEDCRLGVDSLLGKAGMGFTAVGNFSLDHGRYSIAWGAVGLAQACLEAARSYTATRKQFGKPIRDHQLIRRMLTDMMTEVKAARLMCLHAGFLKQEGDPAATVDTNMAKYYASRVANRVASDAVQIHGGNGCSEAYPVQRYFRDAKILEIIEGSTQIQQLLIGKYADFQSL